MKTLRTIAATSLVLATLLILGVVTVSAQGPTGSPATQVAYLDNQSHTLGPNSNQLYRFDYNITNATTPPVVTIRMPNGTRSGLGFEVWTAEQLRAMALTAEEARNDPFNNQPIGRGTASYVNCNTGVLDASASCLSPDLTWTGAFGTGGPYFVKVVNNNNSEASYQLSITGSGLGLGPQAPQQQAAAVPPSAPAAAPALVAAGADPINPITIDTQSHSTAAGNASWYRFDYALKDGKDPQTMTIRLPNGNVNRLAFEVWTAEQLRSMAATAEEARKDPFNNQPIGRGSARQINCDTGMPSGAGLCHSADLTWTGAFGTAGPYFVKVINNGTAESNYQLLLTQ